MADLYDDLSRMLADGWEISGYSTTMMAAGAMTHSVLIRKGIEIKAFTVIFNGSSEIGRTTQTIAPAPPRRR